MSLRVKFPHYSGFHLNLSDLGLQILPLDIPLLFSCSLLPSLRLFIRYRSSLSLLTATALSHVCSHVPLVQYDFRSLTLHTYTFSAHSFAARTLFALTRTKQTLSLLSHAYALRSAHIPRLCIPSLTCYAYSFCLLMCHAYAFRSLTYALCSHVTRRLFAHS